MNTYHPAQSKYLTGLFLILLIATGYFKASAQNGPCGTTIQQNETQLLIDQINAPREYVYIYNEDNSVLINSCEGSCPTSLLANNLATGVYNVSITYLNADETVVICQESQSFYIGAVDCGVVTTTATSSTLQVQNIAAPIVFLYVYDFDGNEIYTCQNMDCPSEFTLQNLAPGPYSVIFTYFDESFAEICNREINVYLDPLPPTCGSNVMPIDTTTYACNSSAFGNTNIDFNVLFNTSGGSISDDNNSGVNLANRSSVNFNNVPVGIYKYTLSCDGNTAVLHVFVRDCSMLQADDKCNCTDYLYLNDANNTADPNNLTQGFMHKFKINDDGTLTEVGDPWVPSGSGFDKPHGLGYDINGFLYIGEDTEGPIRRLQCDGTVIPATEFIINDGGFNFDAKDGVLYVPSVYDGRINAYSLCDGSSMGHVSLSGVPTTTSADGTTPLDWGFQIDDDGTFYATSGWNDYDWNNGLEIYKFVPSNTDFNVNTSYTPFITQASFPAALGDFTDIYGITADEAGNMYVTVLEFSNAAFGAPRKNWIIKFDSNGNLLDSDFEIATGDKKGYELSRGLTYYKDLDVLFIASGLYGDCVAMVNASTLEYIGTAAANVPGQDPKGISLLTECCPVASPLVFNENICATTGEKVFLQEIFSCGEGIICEGMWMETSNTSNGAIVFNECDLSLDVNGSAGCASYNLTSNGGGLSQCGNIDIMVNVCLGNPNPPMVAVNNNMCPSTTGTFEVVEPCNSTSTIEYSIDNGSSWISSLPIWQDGRTLVARCVNDVNSNCISINSNNVIATADPCVVCNISVQCNKLDASCNGSNNGSISTVVTDNTGNITYLWSNNATSSSIANLSPGTYTVTVTDAENCTSSCTAVINNGTDPTATCTSTNKTNCTNPNGSATITSNAASPTYSWSNGATTATINNLDAGSYSATVTDGTTGCTNTCQTTVTSTTSDPTATCTANDNTSCAAVNGSASAMTNASNPIYSWSNGATTAAINGLSAGSYNATITDGNSGCTSTCLAIVNDNIVAVNLSCSSINNTDCDNPNGSVTATAGNVSYLWSTGATTASISNLGSGTYSVTVTDTNTGCTDTCSETVTDPNGPTCILTADSQPTCQNTMGGAISVSASGGSGGYTYQWINNVSTTANATGLGSGQYTVTVTDSNNCSTTCNVTLDSPNGCCSLNALAQTSTGCFDNGTNDNPNDDRVNVGIMVSGNSQTGMFNLTVDGGTTITPNSGSIGFGQFYQLGEGTAGTSNTYTITVTDATDVNCTAVIQVTASGTCSTAEPCPTKDCGGVEVIIN